jgi:hypothetical protein
MDFPFVHAFARCGADGKNGVQREHALARDWPDAGTP